MAAFYQLLCDIGVCTEYKWRLNDSIHSFAAGQEGGQWWLGLTARSERW